MSDKQKCPECRANEAAAKCIERNHTESADRLAKSIRAIRSGCDCLSREAGEKLTVEQVKDLRGRLHVGATGKHEHDAIDALCDLALSALNREYVRVKRETLIAIGTGEFETEYDGWMMTLCSGCSYTDASGHESDCPFKAIENLLAATPARDGANHD